MARENRYSTIVAWVKVVLPMVALGLLATMFLLTRTPDPDAAIPFATEDVAQLAREQRLSGPRFAGTLEDGREVIVVAESATPRILNPSEIVLEGVEADVEVSSADRLYLSAARGDLDLGARSAMLEGDVILETLGGYRLTTDAITVALSALDVVSPGAVVVTAPGFLLEAGAMELTGEDGGAILRFTGGVRLRYEGTQ